MKKNIASIILAAALACGCSAAQVKATAAQAEYMNEYHRCVDDEPPLPKTAPVDVRKAAWARIDACWRAVDERWSIADAQTSQGGGR